MELSPTIRPSLTALGHQHCLRPMHCLSHSHWKTKPRCRPLACGRCLLEIFWWWWPCDRLCQTKERASRRGLFLHVPWLESHVPIPGAMAGQACQAHGPRSGRFQPSSDVTAFLVDHPTPEEHLTEPCDVSVVVARYPELHALLEVCPCVPRLARVTARRHFLLTRTLLVVLGEMKMRSARHPETGS